MKKALKIIVSLLVILVAIFFTLELFLDKAVLKGFNAGAPSLLGVDASLEDASISLIRGTATLKGLHIGNPEGYKTGGLLDLGSLHVKLNTASLFTDTIVVKEILVQGLELTYEKGLLNNNLNALIELLEGGEDDDSADDAQKDEEKEKAKTDDDDSGKKVIIEKLSISGSKMNFSITGAAAITGGGSLPIPLPPITLTDLGKEKEGVTLVEAVQRVLGAIAGAVGTAITGSAELIGKTFGAVGDGLLTVGEGAVDASKAVGGAAVDAGKAVGGAAAGAGKAVGGAAAGVAKALNPFSGDSTDDDE